MSESEISLENEIDLGVQRITGRQEHTFKSKSWCIYTVEQNLKNVHGESTFHPKLVSIGPFHHKSEHLKLMEQHKWRFFSDFLKSMKLTSTGATTSDNDDDALITSTGATTSDNDGTGATTSDNDDDALIMSEKRQCLVAAMEKLEARARACYSEMTGYDDLGSNEFKMMMLLDGCFIIQLLLLFRKTGHSCRNADDPMFTWRSTLPYLMHDLLLLENQLPFFVLHELFAMSGIDNEVYKLTDLIVDFFNPVLYREKMVLDYCKKELVSSNDKAAHLLELFMSSFQTTITVPQEDDQVALQVQEYAQDITNYCVTELREAGIEFKKRDHHDLLDIEFKEGKLHIPTLFIYDSTVPVLLNFIAYEQCRHWIKPYFTSYLVFLDYLVNSSTDVGHLHYKGIINHGLGSDEEVATLINKLCKEVVLDLIGDDNYLSTLFVEVNQYSGKRWNRWRAAWKHEYFRTPWAFTSFLAAIVLIVFTFLQTFFTMYAYFRPSPT